MGLQQICEEVVSETEEALACVLIDLCTGLTLASAQRPDTGLDEADLATALRAGVELFRGKLIDRFARSLPTSRTAAGGFVHEAQITTALGYQFMATVPGWDDGVVVVFTEKDLTLGLGWIAVHQARERFAESPPGMASSPLPLEDEAFASNPGQPVQPVLDPTPIPPPREDTSEPSIPNPLAARNRDGKLPETGGSASEPDEPRQEKRRTLAGPRAKMFRARPPKKKNS